MQVIRELGMEATRPKIISKIMLQNWSLGDIRVARRRHPGIHNLTRYYPWVMSLEPFSCTGGTWRWPWPHQHGFCAVWVCALSVSRAKCILSVAQNTAWFCVYASGMLGKSMRPLQLPRLEVCASNMGHSPGKGRRFRWEFREAPKNGKCQPHHLANSRYVIRLVI